VGIVHLAVVVEFYHPPHERVAHRPGWRRAAISHSLESARAEVDGPAAGFALASPYRLARASSLEGSPDG